MLRQSAGGSLVAYTNFILSGIYGITGSIRGKRWDWRVVGDYRFSDQFLAYASVSTGFKGGGVNPRPFVADQRLSFNPETLTTYEIGFKADLLDRKVRLNGAAFLNKYSNIVLGKTLCPESSLPSPCLRPANIGSVDVKGFELEATVRPVDGLTFDGSLSVLDFKYTTATTGNPAVLVGTGIPASGITPYTPELSYSVGAQYDYQADIGTISVRFDGSYQGKLFTNAENTVWAKVPGRFLGNGQISFSDKNRDWKFTFEVKNLFDKYYFTSKSDVTSPGNLGVVTGVPGLPRTWMLSVKRNF
jgi:iron complex outermembrane receptor protein